MLQHNSVKFFYCLLSLFSICLVSCAQEDNSEIGASIQKKVYPWTTKAEAIRFELRSKRNDHPDAQWFPDAGLGLFIGWGLPSLHGHCPWAAMRGCYKESYPPSDFWAKAEGWNPRRYDPDKWLKAAKAAGFRYAVFTTKHHLGYTMWPSKYSDMGVQKYMNGRDLVKPYVEACRNNGLKVGLYFSGPDWYFDRDHMNFDYKGWLYSINWTGGEPTGVFLNWKHERVDGIPEMTDDFKQRSIENSFNQVRELLSNYGKIDILWQDGGVMLPMDERRKLQPSLLVTGRNDKMDGDFCTPEELKQLKYEYIKAVNKEGNWWELCTRWTCGSWFYSDKSDKMFDTGTVLFWLAKIRCWSGNLIINVTPTPDGELLPIVYERFAEMGEWMKHSGESIFGITGGGVYPENSNVPVTKRNNVWYLHSNPEPSTWDEPIELISLNAKPLRAWLLRTGHELPFTYDSNGTFSLLIPKDMRTSLVDVVAVEMPESEKAETCNITPVPNLPSDHTGNWVLQSDYSDEFSDNKLNFDKWDNDVFDWGDWSWEPENAYVQDGNLHIRMQYKEHMRGGQKKYYTSGIIRSRAQPIMHGFFEARIKGALRFPGVCPGFWVFKIEPSRFTEIDFLELTQYFNNPRKIDFNTHVFKHRKLKSEEPLHEVRSWIAPWDPWVDFHTYGCEWNQEEIKWYVDGKLVASRKNDFWDQPLDVAVSMATRVPLKAEPSEEGFPTEMIVDYVRVWKKPQP